MFRYLVISAAIFCLSWHSVLGCCASGHGKTFSASDEEQGCCGHSRIGSVHSERGLHRANQAACSAKHRHESDGEHLSETSVKPRCTQSECKHSEKTESFQQPDGLVLTKHDADHHQHGACICPVSFGVSIGDNSLDLNDADLLNSLDLPLCFITENSCIKAFSLRKQRQLLNDSMVASDRLAQLLCILQI